MALWELRDTCPSLFRHFSDYRTAKQSTSPSKYSSKQWNAMLTMSWLPWPLRSILKFLPHHDEAGDYWNMCHFWTNFEIADMEFFRSQEYRDLFSSLDASGNFYNERVCPNFLSLFLKCVGADVSSGAMHRFIHWLFRCFLNHMNYITFQTLDTSMTRSSIVPTTQQTLNFQM